MLSLQRELHERVARGDEPDTWLVVEHEPVITLGRNAKLRNVLVSQAMLAEKGIEVVAVERGGDVTFHGPGQLVVYPIVRLARFREVVPFVSALEAAVVSALNSLGVLALARNEHRGVYVRNAAICAIGLAVKQMTTLHGLALNVCTELDYGRLISPCGMPQFGVTSLSRELGRKLELAEARDALIPELERHFRISFETAETIACDPGRVFSP